MSGPTDSILHKHAPGSLSCHQAPLSRSNGIRSDTTTPRTAVDDVLQCDGGARFRTIPIVGVSAVLKSELFARLQISHRFETYNVVVRCQWLDRFAIGL